MIYRHLLIICIISFITLATPPYLHSQGERSFEDAQRMLEAGTGAFDTGNFQDAAKRLRAFTEKYPDNPQAPLARYLTGIAEYSAGNYQAAAKALENSEGFPKEVLASAGFHFGASNYFLGNYDAAIKAFRFASRPPEKKEGDAEEEDPAEEIRPFALFYLGRALMEYGQQLESEEKAEEAQKAWKEGVEALDTMVETYPDNALIPDTLMSRASMNVFRGNLETAATQLKELKTTPGGETMAEEADYLLGYVQSQQAVQLLSDFKDAEAREKTRQARETYQRLIESDNLVIANEAAFQLANLDFADKQYDDAIRAYRSLKSKERLIESQRKRMEQIRQQIRDAGGNAQQIARIQRALKREEQKLSAVQANPELAKEAIGKIGEAYLQMGKYNLARIVFRHAQKFVESEQKNRLEVQIILSHAAQGNTQEAETIFNQFRQSNPKDPMAQNVKFLLGNAFLQQERYEDALKAFDESLAEFPESPSAAQIPKLKAQAYMGMGQKEEAMKSFRDFIAEAEAGQIKVAPTVVEDTRRLLAFALYGEGQVDEALQILQKLSSEATSAPIKEEATFQVANLQAQRGSEEAVPLLRQFAESYPESPNAPRAALQAATLLEKSGKMDEARQQYRKVIEVFPEDPMALFAYDRLWRSHADDFEKMKEIQDELVENYPNSERALAALFDRAKTLENKIRDLDAALEAYLQVVEKGQAIPAPEQNDKTIQFTSFALVSAAMVEQKRATSLGNYPSLEGEEKSNWEAYLNASQELLVRAVTEFPGTKVHGLALTRLKDVLLNQVANDIMPMNEAVTLLSQLAGQMRDEADRIKVLVTQAGMLNQAGQSGQALSIYADSFEKLDDPKSVNWQDMDTYGTLLLEGKKFEEALDIYRKMASVITEKQQHAQAAATYGQGAALQGMGQSNEAAQFFNTLQEKYPWSPKIMEAQYASAVTLFDNAKYSEAVEALKEVIKSPRSDNESKARSMILVARAYQQMGDKGISTPDTELEDGSQMDIYDLAANNLAKVEVFYADSLPVLSSEALYRAVAIRKKQGKDEEANEMIDRLLNTYPTTEWAQKARTDF